MFFSFKNIKSGDEANDAKARLYRSCRMLIEKDAITLTLARAVDDNHVDYDPLSSR